MSDETNIVEAPGIVPLQNEAEFFQAEVFVQTPEETGEEDLPVKGQAEILAERGHA